VEKMSGDKSVTDLSPIEKIGLLKRQKREKKTEYRVFSTPRGEKVQSCR